jgi:hypothetical protein
MNINRDESCNTPRFEVIGQCEGCGKTLFENDDCAYTLDDIYLCKKCSQGIEQYSEPYKAEDVIPIVAKMNSRVTTKRTGADRSESRFACDAGQCSDVVSESYLSANIDDSAKQKDGGSPSLTPSQNVESPVNDQQAKQRSCADNGNLQQEAVWANVCGTDILEKHCLSTEGTILTNGPLKTQIIRCPKCGSSNVHLGHATIYGTPVCCKECGHFEPSKRTE